MKRLLMTCLLLSSLIFASGIQAQTTNQPVYAYHQGDLWKFDLIEGTATPLTEWGYNGGPILSPDGRVLAHLSAASPFIAQYHASAATQIAGTPPVNIWVMDLATESFRLIANQSDASIAGYLRSMPAWSPDSRQLAWLQLDPNVQALDMATLQVHNLDSGETSTLATNVNLGHQEDQIQMPRLQWGAGGIARLLFTFPYQDQNAFQFLEVYDPNTGTLTQHNLGLEPNRGNFVSNFLWVNHQGRSLIALQIQDYWELLEPQEGTRARLTDPPHLKNRLFSGGIELIPASIADGHGAWEIHWYATTGNNLYHTGYVSRGTDIGQLPVLSSDGRQVAWHNGDRISSWYLGIAESNRAQTSDASAKRAFPIPEPVSLVWAPSEWVTTGSLMTQQADLIAQPAASACELTPLLNAGQRAIVSPGLANRVRSAATTNAEIIGRIEAGEIVTIESEPVCADGYHWYAIRNEEIAGWTAEGNDGEYWLLYHVDCPNSPPIRLTTSMTATVTEGRTGNLRDGIGNVNTEVTTVLSPGNQFLITGPPQCDEGGIRWYPAQFSQILGWIAAGEGEEYWIEPADNQVAG